MSPDLVVISTPTNNHFESIKNLLKLYSPQIIICEKPLSFSLIESKKIESLCSEKTVKLIINYPRISDPSINIIRSNIKSKKYSLPAEGTVWYSKSLFNSGIHFVNLMIYLFGQYQDIRILSKVSDNFLHVDLAPYFLVKFKDVNINFISLKKQNIFLNEFKIIFCSGVLNYRNAGKIIEWFQSNSEDFTFSSNSLNPHSFKFDTNFDNMQFDVTKEIEKYIRYKRGNLCDIDLAIETEKMLKSILEMHDQLSNE